MIIETPRLLKNNYAFYKSKRLYDNVLLEYHFAGPGDYTDHGSKGLDGTENGTVTYTAEQYGAVLEFGGGTGDNIRSGSYVTQPPSIWAAEVLLHIRDSATANIVTFYAGGNYDRSIYIDGSGNLIGYLYDGASKTVNWGAVTTGELYHIILSTDGSTLMISANGKSTTTSVTNGGFTGYTNAEWYIGGAPSLGGSTSRFYYARLLDEYLDEDEANVLTDGRNIFEIYENQKVFIPAQAVTGRIMGALAGHGGLAGPGGLAGSRGGLAG